MYWLSCTTALLGDTDYDLYVDFRNTFALEAMGAYRKIQNDTDAAIADQSDPEAYLAKANDALAAESLKRQTKLLGDMVIMGSEHMKLRYNLND